MRTQKVKYYRIDGVDKMFPSLLAAKSFFAVELKTWKERVSFVGTCIYGYDYDDRLVTVCQLRRVGNNGRLYFSKSSCALPSVV